MAAGATTPSWTRRSSRSGAPCRPSRWSPTRRWATSSDGGEVDVVVIGAGQAGLAGAFYLRRASLSYLLLDAEEGPGAAWRHGWPSLRLFSPAQWSSLPGWMMPRSESDYPSRDELLAYLAEYERRYEIPVRRPVRVHAVRRGDRRLHVDTTVGSFRARAVIAATGSWSNPVIPDLAGRSDFGGEIIHSAHYAGPDSFVDRRVLVIGGGNSGAQIAAELAESHGAHAVRWVTREPPTFLPESVDGRYLFEQATARYRALQEGGVPEPPRSLGDIVRVPPVRRALERGLLVAHPMFARLVHGGALWSDGTTWPADAVILATGFRPALGPLAPLGVVEPDGRVAVAGTRSVKEPRLWLLGYGDWTGFASATLIGVGRSARTTAEEIRGALEGPSSI